MTGKLAHRARRPNDPRHRRLLVETLEVRRLLAVSGVVKGNGVVIADGDLSPSSLDATDFGNATANINSVTKTYTIQNTGDLSYNLTGTPLVQLGDNTNFTVIAAPSATIVPGGTTTFQVRFNPTTTGLLSTTISIANNDANPGFNPYTYTIQGNGIPPAPTINVQGNGLAIPDNDITPSVPDGTIFGSATVVSAG